jgi:cytochrome c oxidase assembly protein subunit 15
VRALSIASLLLVLVLVPAGAYLRLDSSGIGCADWPACYGMIGRVADEAPTLGSTYERLVVDATEPLSWVTPVHRLVASVLGLLILGMAIVSLRTRKHRPSSFTLLALTVFLAWLGIYSDGLHSLAVVLAVVMGNLGGGFAMLGLLGWTVFRDAKPHANASLAVRRWVTAALLLLCVQIALGGLTGANFAAAACPTFPDCNGTWLPGGDLWAAFDLTRQLETDSTGLALGGAERADIHKLHRIVGVITLLASFAAAALAQRAKLGIAALAVLILVVAEFGIGVASILMELPIGVAVAHNWLAAILLLSLLRLWALCRNRQALL